MEGGEFSVSAISARKLAETSQQVQVKILKKALNQEGEIAKQLIQAAVASVPEPGKGAKVNVVA